MLCFQYGGQLCVLVISGHFQSLWWPSGSMNSSSRLPVSYLSRSHSYGHFCSLCVYVWLCIYVFCCWGEGREGGASHFSAWEWWFHELGFLFLFFRARIQNAADSWCPQVLLPASKRQLWDAGTVDWPLEKVDPLVSIYAIDCTCPLSHYFTKSIVFLSSVLCG